MSTRIDSAQSVVQQALRLARRRARSVVKRLGVDQAPPRKVTPPALHGMVEYFTADQGQRLGGGAQKPARSE